MVANNYKVKKNDRAKSKRVLLSALLFTPLLVMQQVALDPRGAGAKMIHMLLALMDGTPVADLQELWPCELLPGESAGPVPS